MADFSVSSWDFPVNLLFRECWFIVRRAKPIATKKSPISELQVQKLYDYCIYCLLVTSSEYCLDLNV